MALRLCAIALDKWLLLEVHTVEILLGLLWNMRDMTVSITPDFRMETVHLIQHTWHDGREYFEMGELELFVGKLGQIGQTYRPIYHLMHMMYASATSAPCENHDFLVSTNRGYRKIVKKAKQKALNKHDTREIRFTIGQATRKIHACNQKYIS